MRNRGIGNIVVTHALTKKGLFNSAWDKGDLSNIPRQLPQGAGKDCETCSCFWLLMVVLWHTNTLLMLLLLSLVFPSVVRKATAFTAAPVTIFWMYFHFTFSAAAAFVSVQCNKQPAEPPALTQRGAGCHKQLPKGRDHKVSLARHAGGLRHALPTSQKIQILNEGSAGLPPAPAPLGDVDGVSQGWAAAAASSLQS